MKKLFSTDKSLIFPERGDLFSWVSGINIGGYLNRNGEEVEYTPLKLTEDELEEYYECKVDDPTSISDAFEGYYAYTTQPYVEDMDGKRGCFGIKDVDGNIVVEEQFEEIDYFFNGLCSVKPQGKGWGCIDATGATVIPFIYCEPVRFNCYGVALGDDSLIDREGKPIEGTKLNIFDSYYDEDDRYFTFKLLPDDVSKELDECGHSDKVTIDVYDTKERCFVAKDVPDGKLYIYSKDAEPEVIKQASAMTDTYDHVKVWEKALIIARKGEITTVFEFEGDSKLRHT